MHSKSLTSGCKFVLTVDFVDHVLLLHFMCVLHMHVFM